MKMGLDLRRSGSAAVAIFALACLGPGTERAPRMYVLDAVVPVSESPKVDWSIGVGPVSIPDRLDRPQILTRTSDHEVEIAEFDRWAEPLEEGLATVLAEDLSRAIPTDRVAVYPWRRATPVDLQVVVVVTRFEREPDGGVTLTARWRVVGSEGREVLPQRTSSYREPAGNSAPEIVDAMSRAVGVFAADITTALRAVHGNASQ